MSRLTPASVELALALEEELRTRGREADELRRLQAERARYEADLARRRYVQVDPSNRLVAETLEAEWNAKLRAVRDAEEQYERLRSSPSSGLDPRIRADLRTLADDVTRLWADPATQDQDRKRIVRLMIEDVTLIRSPDQVTAQIRFKGGTFETIAIAAPKPMCEVVRTSPEVLRLIDEWLNDSTAGEIAERLKMGEGSRVGWARVSPANG